MATINPQILAKARPEAFRRGHMDNYFSMLERYLAQFNNQVSGDDSTELTSVYVLLAELQSQIDELKELYTPPPQDMTERIEELEALSHGYHA